MARDRIVTVLFALLLLAPAALTLAGRSGADDDFIDHTELRRPFQAPPPTSGALATGGWERDLERQIADGFPLRRQLIERYDFVKYAWFHDVATTHVVEGSNGWLFDRDEEAAYDDGTYDPSDAELGRLAGLFQARADWCARRGITYVFVPVPNKSTIYAQYLPAGVRHVTPPAGERLIPLLRARGVRVVDLRAPLIHAAAAGEVYSKGDTHWNDAGAYAAYRAIVRAVGDAGVRDTIAPGSITARVIWVRDADLYRLAGISSLVPNAVVTYDFPRRARPVAVPDSRQNSADGFERAAFERDDRSLPKAVVFGDSFTGALRGFLAEDFRRTVVLQHDIVSGVQFDRAAIEAEKPAVVIDELIERVLVNSAAFKP